MGFIKWLLNAQSEWEQKQKNRGSVRDDYYIDNAPWAYDDPKVIRYSKIYYDNLGKLEERYSIIYNMGLIEGDEVDAFIRLCEQNIIDFNLYKEACMPYKEEMPYNVPAYKRLAMIYEKQGRYREAIEICATAINNGVVDDGTKGRMRGRLARLIRKYDGDLPNSILKLLD